jgi:hypothetical protein
VWGQVVSVVDLMQTLLAVKEQIQYFLLSLPLVVGVGDIPSIQTIHQ